MSEEAPAGIWWTVAYAPSKHVRFYSELIKCTSVFPFSITFYEHNINTTYFTYRI